MRQSKHLIVFVTIAALISPVWSTVAQAAGKEDALKALVKILTAAGAAEAARRSGENYQQYQQTDAILAKLKSQGAAENENAIYAFYLTLNSDASPVYWADIFNKPDVFFAVDIEGRGTFIVPQIRYEYGGGPILDRILAERVPPGARIVVRVMDDDTWSDDVWNNILRTRVNFDVNGQVSATRCVAVTATVSGQLQLVDRRLTLDAPDHIAWVEFRVPSTENDQWVVEGQLFDSSNRPVGQLQMAAMWSAKVQVGQLEANKSSFFGKTLFWGVLAGALILWFLKSLFEKAPAASEKT